MTQRKLTDGELQDVMHAKHYLRKVVNLGGHSVYASIVLDDLDRMAAHGTTDGKLYIEPQPEIGEGYRLATEADSMRRDRRRWCDGFWVGAEVGVTICDHVYCVPIDRIPTDDDAKQRPIVMVRDRGYFSWHSAKLIGVVGGSYPFVVERISEARSYRQSRFPYPGELP